MSANDRRAMSTDSGLLGGGFRQLLTREQERALSDRAASGSDLAFEQLVEAHLPLVFRIAREHAGHGLAFDDLVAEGALGLVEATRRYDPTRGARLAVYASFWIRAYVRKFTICNRRIVRPPSSRNARRLLSTLGITQRQLEQQQGGKPDPERVAQQLAVSSHEVEEMTTVLSARDVPYGIGDADSTGFELGSDVFNPEAALAEHEEHDVRLHALHQAFAALDERERKILRRRSLVSEPASRAEIGRDLGMSRERVRQIESGAQVKLRCALGAP